MEFSIRKTLPDDVPDVVMLIREFAVFEELSDHCAVTEENLHTAMFGTAATVEGLIALDDDGPMGYALYYPNFSSFSGQRGLYIEDIYISERYRGGGLGLAMIKEIASIAASRGFERIDFMVLDWNSPAINFYRKHGALSNDDETHFKFSEQAFRDLAS
ncbi:MAG: GNAT family N-acetyltransferase [Pyrinomonadaceae bacterium]